MVFGSHSKTCAIYSIPPCPSFAASTAAYRRRSFSDSQLKNRFIFPLTSTSYTSMLPSLPRDLLCSKDTMAQAVWEVILDHILNCPKPPVTPSRLPGTSTSLIARSVSTNQRVSPPYQQRPRLHLA